MRRAAQLDRPRQSKTSSVEVFDRFAVRVATHRREGRAAPGEEEASRRQRGEGQKTNSEATNRDLRVESSFEPHQYTRERNSSSDVPVFPR